MIKKLTKELADQISRDYPKLSNLNLSSNGMTILIITNCRNWKDREPGEILIVASFEHF